MHFLISLCRVCHKAIEFTDSGEKIVLPAHKEQRLNSLMLTLASRSLKEWTKGVLSRRGSNRPKRRKHQGGKQSPEYLNGRPIRQIAVHDLARTVESLTYDMQQLGAELSGLKMRLIALEQRLAALGNAACREAERCA